MQHLTLSSNISLLCVKATSFPDGIMQAFKTLYSIFPPSGERRSFGLSCGNEQNGIDYWACAEELDIDVLNENELQRITIRAGDYNYEDFPNFMQNLPAIGETFQRILSATPHHTHGYCVEEYLNDSDVRCLVRLSANSTKDE